MKQKFKISITSIICSLAMVSSVFGASFYDINNVPWEGAKTYINSVADKGLMVGDKDAKGNTVFRAKDKVTYNETMQLAYSAMSKAGKINSSTDTVTKWKSIMSGNKIPEWAYPAVSYGLDKGILSISDVSKFMSNFGASNNASREDVAVIMGKTLGTIYNISGKTDLDFKDASKIASSSLQYVYFLVDMDILVGDDAGNFNPRNSINRAEMAVIVSKISDKLGGGSGTTVTGNTVSGTVTSTYTYGSNFMVSVNVNGVDTGFMGSDSIPVTYNGEKQLWTDITMGDVITITLNNDRQPVSAVLTYDFIPAKRETISGTIEDLSNTQIVVKKSSGYGTYTIDSSNVTLTLDGEKSSIKDFTNALNDGYNIEASVVVKNDTQALEIKGTTNAVTKTGTLVSLSSSKVVYKKSGTSYTYELSDDSTFKLNGSSSSVSKINSALDSSTLYVTITLNKDDEAKIISAYDEKYEVEYDGYIESISSSEIKINTGSKTKTYDMSSSVTYKLDDSSSTLSKIKRAMDDGKVNVLLTFNTNNEVSKVEAYNKSSADKLSGRITSITSSKITFKLTGSSSTTRYDYDSDDIEIEVDGKSRGLSYLKAYLEDDDYISASIELDKDSYVTSITATLSDDENILYGQLYGVEKSEIRFQEFDGSKKYYDLASSSKLTVRIKDSSSTISDLIDYYDDESAVYAKIELDGDTVIRIDASNKKSDISSSSSGSSETLSGIVLLDISKSEVVYKTSLTSTSKKTKSFASGYTVRLDASSATISELQDLIEDDILLEGTITLNSSGDVSRIVVTSSESTSGYLNYIIEGRISIRESVSNSSKTTTYSVIDSYYLTIKLDGSSVSYSTLSSKASSNDIYVKLVRNSKGEVNSITATTK